MDGDTVSLWSHNIKIVTVTVTKSETAKTSGGLRNGYLLVKLSVGLQPVVTL